MRDYVIQSIAPGATFILGRPGTVLWLKESSDALRVTFQGDEKPTGAVTLQAGDKISIPEGFNRVLLANNTAAAVSAVVVIGKGDAAHASVQVTASVSGTVKVQSGGTLGGSNDVAVALGASVTLSAAAVGKREVLLSVISGSVRVGSAPAANNGHPMAAGDSLILTVADEVKAFGVADSSVSVVEVKE